MAAVIIILLILVALYFWLSRDAAEVRERGKNRPAEQKQALRYFWNTGIFQKKVSDAVYDKMVREHADKFNDLKRALHKAGVDESEITEVKPIYLENYVFGDKNTYSKMGKDGLWRSSKYQISWLFGTSSQLYLYQYTFNLDEDGKKESTEEYFYKDITNVTTSSDTIETPVWDLKKKEYVLKNIDTHRLKISVPGESLYAAMTDTEEIRKSVQGLKGKLREKKGA